MLIFIMSIDISPSSLKSLELSDLQKLFVTTIPPDVQPPTAFFDRLNASDKATAFQLCLLAWDAAASMASRIWQLRERHEKDTLF